MSGLRSISTSTSSTTSHHRNRNRLRSENEHETAKTRRSCSRYQSENKHGTANQTILFPLQHLSCLRGAHSWSGLLVVTILLSFAQTALIVRSQSYSVAPQWYYFYQRACRCQFRRTWTKTTATWSSCPTAHPREQKQVKDFLPPIVLPPVSRTVFDPPVFACRLTTQFLGILRFCVSLSSGEGSNSTLVSAFGGSVMEDSDCSTGTSVRRRVRVIWTMVGNK